MTQKKVLLINPSMSHVYEGTFLKNSFPHYPPLSLLVVAGALKQKNIPVELLDLDLVPQEQIYEIVKNKVREYTPSVVRVTFPSALYSQCVKIAKTVKQVHKDILLVAGGSHPSSKPVELVRETPYDLAIVGEGEFALAEVMSVSRKNWGKVPGLAFKGEKKNVVLTEKRAFVKDLDKLPLPMYGLVNIYDYDVPPSFRRQSPVAPIETSRGCVWGCTYCNKSVFGRNFRYKSPERTVQEIEQLVSLGYKEIHINDDMFTTIKDRVKQICRLLIKKNVKVSWACPNGIRADRVDRELIRLMKRAGCYRVSFGAESGNQQILDNIDKLHSPEQAIQALKLCREEGMMT